MALDLKLDASDDIYTDPDTADIAMVTGADEVAQSLKIKLRLFLGEWFENLEAGLPYYQHCRTR